MARHSTANAPGALRPAPGPPSWPPLAAVIAFRRDPLAFALRGARYGDVVRHRMGPRDVYQIVHPEHIKDVLVTHQHRFAKGRALQWARLFLGNGLLTSEPPAHTRQRRLAQPAFHRQRVASYAAVMVEHAERTSARWRDGARVDMAREMMTLTMGVAARTLFDAEVEGEAAEIGRSLDVVVRHFPRFLLPFPRLVERLPLPSNRRFAEARARLDATIYRMIAERRRSGEDRGDLLSMLLHARDVDGDGQGMDDRQLRDEMMTLFLAGHETTANALAWTWYLLSQNPEAEASLHEEVGRALEGRAPAADDVPRLAYVEQVVAESMRLYPPAWAIGRRALEDHDLGGYRIPAGAILMLSPFVTQRDPRWYPEPLRFDPSRFAPEARSVRPRFAYFPFGGGARQCIGEPFAWMEAVLVMAALTRHWRARVVPGHRVTPQPLITLRPRGGLPMTVHRR